MATLMQLLEQETIQFYFLTEMARVAWCAIHLVFNITMFGSVAHIFGSWLQGVDKSLRSLVLVVASAVVCSI